MKFATKLSLGCIALLSCALGAAGLLLTGQSFSGSLASTRTALQAQQEKEKYALERIIFQATDSAQFENYILAAAAQQYAEQTADAGSSMALWLDGAYALYSGLPAALPRTALKQALTNGENAWQLTRAAGRWYLLLTQPLDLPGVRADMLCAYDVSAVFATRDAQLRAWLAASAALLVLGGGAAVLFSRRVTRPLTALQTASEKIADGEYTQRTQVKTDDEIGALSRSFDAMAAAVEGKINELSKTTQSQQDFIAAFTHEVKTPMTAMLGYADLMLELPLSRCSMSAVLLDLYVTAPQRGRGIGTGLLIALFRQAQSLGCGELAASCQRVNVRGREFLERQGFVLSRHSFTRPLGDGAKNK